VIWFDNHFVRGSSNWTTIGSGFSVGSINFLMGHAASGAGLALGLRCLALVRYDALGWLFGTLLSVHHEKRTPIAARVVLVPAKYHPKLEIPAAPKEERVRQIIGHIQNAVTVTQLDDQIRQLDPNGNSIFEDKKASDYIRFLIRNWTLTTLEASQEDLPIDRGALSQLREIWGIEEELASVWEKVHTGNGRYLSALKLIMEDRATLYGWGQGK
jgi:hypothetical protein